MIFEERWKKANNPIKDAILKKAKESDTPKQGTPAIVADKPLEEKGVAADINIKPESSYDLQRQSIQSEGEMSDKAQRQMLAERLATRGFGKGSGFAEAQQRLSAADRSGAISRRLGAVDVSQRQSEEAERKALEAEARGDTRAQYTALGQAGKELTPEQQAIIDSNPVAKAAYEAGQAARSLTQEDRSERFRLAALNAIDPETGEVSSDFLNLLKQLGDGVAIDALTGTKEPMNEEEREIEEFIATQENENAKKPSKQIRADPRKMVEKYGAI